MQSNEFIKYFITEYMSQNELNLVAIRDIFIACQLRDAFNQCNCNGTKEREKSNQIKSKYYQNDSMQLHQDWH